MSDKSSILPYNVMELEDNGFFEFMKLFSGEKLATLLKFQDISNAECLLGCGDPFEILSFDSDDFLNLKQKMGIKLNDNSFAVLPGINSKMKLLKDALIKKRNELNRKARKTTSSTISTNNTSSIALSAENSNTHGVNFCEKNAFLRVCETR